MRLLDCFTKNRGIRVLCYHSIDDSGSLVSVSPAIFRSQMEWLARSRFEVIPLSEAVQYLADGKKPTRPVVAITFDDGYRSLIDHALPQLEAHGFSATVFLVTGCMGGRSKWVERDFPELFELDQDQQNDQKRLIQAARVAFKERIPYFYKLPNNQLESIARQTLNMAQLPLLSWDDARMMMLRGIDFGAHTVTHPFLPTLSKDAAVKEITESRSHIEEQLNTTVKAFCYPYGALDEQLKQLTEEAGFTSAFSTDPGINSGCNPTPFSMKRVSIHEGTSFLRFRFYLSMLYPWYLQCRTIIRC